MACLRRYIKHYRECVIRISDPTPQHLSKKLYTTARLQTEQLILFSFLPALFISVYNMTQTRQLVLPQHNGLSLSVEGTLFGLIVYYQLLLCQHPAKEIQSKQQPLNILLYCTENHKKCMKNSQHILGTATDLENVI